MLNNLGALHCLSPVEEKPYFRTIRSYVCRQGRCTAGQARALHRLWPLLGVAYCNKTSSMAALFGRDAPTILEIGFGMGESFITLAQQNPAYNFLGVEVYRPGVGACLMAAARAGINNVRLICHDAVEVLQNMIIEESLARVQLFFPDPWPKKRHHKRRLVQQPFIRLLQSKLIIGGLLHIATDWQPYAEHIVEILQMVSGFHTVAPEGNYQSRPHWRPKTQFEQRGERLGHKVWEIVVERSGGRDRVGE